MKKREVKYFNVSHPLAKAQAKCDPMAIQREGERDPVTNVNILSEDDVIEAKEWVDSNIK